MDLQTLQNQLKSAIQNHQIIVGKMRKDPQNSSLQKQLHDLQSDIMTLSDKQKQVVQQLRKDLDKKSAVLPPRTIHSAQQSVIQKSSVQTQALSLTTKPKQTTAAHQIIQHVVPSLVNNLVAAATSAFKTPIATAVLLPSATSLLTGRPVADNNNHRSQPLLVVPSPTIRPADSHQHHPGLVFNLAPPIRVPQYPPPNCRPSTCQTNSVTSTVNACSTVLAIQSTVKERRSHSNFILSSPRRNAPGSKPGSNEQVKMNFISALGLVTRDALSELQSKRVERKRRTTANPQFSNAALEEKRKNAAALLNPDGKNFHIPFKRPRGRPRNNPTPTNSRPTTPDAPQQSSSPAPATPVPTKEHGTTVAIAYTNHRSPREISIVNGFHPIAIRPALPPPPSQPPSQTMPISPALSLHQKEAVEEKCAVCRQTTGDLLTCFSCKCPYHSKCLQSPADSKPWHCPKCHTYQAKVAPQWTETVAVVHSYIAIKAAKEEEKKKLLKRSLELKSERTELEEKKKHLNSVIAEQRDARTELELRHKKSQDSIEKLHQVVAMIQQVS